MTIYWAINLIRAKSEGIRGNGTDWKSNTLWTDVLIVRVNATHANDSKLEFSQRDVKICENPLSVKSALKNLFDEIPFQIAHV